ncbi:MAG: peptidase E [Clostridiaceae bacterium]
MGTIIAIGGGEIEHRETEGIDRFVVALAKKKSPRLLFLPTASGDAGGYIQSVTHYFTNLGCTVDHLSLIKEKYEGEEIKQKILSSDIIYVGGGDTVSMMSRWKALNVDDYLKEAYAQGVILSGLSAGSICWFKYGHSDSDSFRGSSQWDYIRAYGLGLVPSSHCPHYDEVGRDSYDEMVLDDKIPGIALENKTALVYIDGKYRIIKSDEKKNAYLLRMIDGKLTKTIIGGDEFEL